MMDMRRPLLLPLRAGRLTKFWRFDARYSRICIKSGDEIVKSGHSVLLGSPHRRLSSTGNRHVYDRKTRGKLNVNVLGLFCCSQVGLGFFSVSNGPLIYHYFEVGGKYERAFEFPPIVEVEIFC